MTELKGGGGQSGAGSATIIPDFHLANSTLRNISLLDLSLETPSILLQVVVSIWNRMLNLVCQQDLGTS